MNTSGNTTCTCGACPSCRWRASRRRHVHLPRTPEEAIKLRNHFHKILWPPVWESVRELEEQFPHLRELTRTPQRE